MYDSFRAPLCDLQVPKSSKVRHRTLFLSVNGETFELAEQIILMSAGLSHSKDSRVYAVRNDVNVSAAVSPSTEPGVM